jgi:hypothetical protein
VADAWSPEKRFERLSRFGFVPNFEWYQEIYEFLSDEKRVSQHLAGLAAAAMGSGVEAFKAALAKVETDNKFASPVDIGDLLYGPVFMGYIGAKRPVNDRGVPRETHGILTHRIQWALVALELAGSLPGSVSVADLYAGLARPNTAVARDPAVDGTYIDVGSDTVSLWSVLVDSPYRDTSRKWQVRNARSPEFLMAYLDAHADSALRQMHVYSEHG